MAYFFAAINTNNTIDLSTIGSIIQRCDDGTTSMSVSAPFSSGDSFQSGTLPTAGIYEVTSSSAAAVRFKKYHYAKGQDSGNFQAYTEVSIDWDSSYGIRWTLRSSNGSYGIPATPYDHHMNSQYIPTSPTSPTNLQVMKLGTGGLSAYEGFHIIANDKVFAIALNYGTSSTYGALVSDLEYIAALDAGSFTDNSVYTPQVSHVWIAQYQNTKSAYPPSASYANSGYFYRWQYKDYAGNYQNGPAPYGHVFYSPPTTYVVKGGSYPTTANISYAGYNFNYDESYSYYGTTLPEPRRRIFPLKSSTGTIHPLIPMVWFGHANGGANSGNFNTGDPRVSRMLDMYRTSEETFQNGDIVTDNGVKYRVLKWNKGGSCDMYEAVACQALAFPENSTAFS